MKIVAGLWRLVLSLALMETSQVLLAEDRSLPLETPVKVLRSAPPASPVMETRAMPRPVPTPTTPGAKHPQYQLGHQQRQTSQPLDVANPSVRFFLALPKGPLLIEAMITIDGLPFRMLRQQRVERILKEIAVEKGVATGISTVTESIPSRTATAANGTKTTSNIPDRLRHTMNLTGEVPTEEEVYWILSNWVDGPTIMQLNDNFQRFRANQRPEFAILDRNRDGTVSAEEMQLAAQSFQECDLNQDGIIQFTEISAGTAGLSASHDGTRIGESFARLGVKSFDTLLWFDIHSRGQFEAEELLRLRRATPDLMLSIAFNSVIPEKSRIAVTAVAAEFEKAVRQATVDATGITLTLGGTPVIFAAVQMQPSDQISIGAVNDGYPLLPSLDPNDDGRFTIRELRGLLETLKTFDRNHDGALTNDETQSPIRVCFGLGASVHRELAGIRSLHRKESAAPTVGPEWFVRMDRNKDNDLTRGEFPGTDEQFMDLDADADELVSADEALEFDKKVEDTGKGDDRPVANQRTETSNDSTYQEETRP